MEFELEKEKARMEALHRDIERMSVMAVSDSAPTSSARAPLALWQPSASTHGERPCAELGVGDPSSNGLRASSFMIPPSPSDLLLPLKSARVTPTPLCGKAMAGCGSRSEVAHTGKLIAAGGVAASSGGDVDVQVGDVGEEASSVRMERQVEGVGERAGDALLVRGATQSSSGSAKADGESIAEELMGSDMWMAVRDAFARCPPSTHALLHLLRGRAGGALASVGNFLDSTTAYILSKTWHDLLSTYVFGLHPMPFCSSKFGINSCSAPAPSGIQFSYAFFILLVGTGLRMLAQTDRFKHLPGIDSVPSMVGMCVGWAYGDACLELLDEMVKAQPALCGTPFSADPGMPRDCTQFNVLMSTALLLVASLLIGLLQPFTKNIEFGNGKFIDTVEDALETVWILLSKGCATAVMVVWTSTLTKLELNGISSSTPSVVRTHMHIFWAIAITLSGSLLCSTLERAECWLQRQEQQQEKRLFDAVDAEKAVEGAQKSAAIHRSINRLSAYIEGSNLMQATLGWVAGVAWTDVALDMFPMLSQPPTLINLMMNIGASLVLTLLSVLYLVLTADNCRIVDLTDRAQVEKHFLVGAMSFFAGWGWVLVIRDVFYPVGAGIQACMSIALTMCLMCSSMSRAHYSLCIHPTQSSECGFAPSAFVGDLRLRVRSRVSSTYSWATPSVRGLGNSFQCSSSRPVSPFVSSVLSTVWWPPTRALSAQDCGSNGTSASQRRQVSWMRGRGAECVRAPGSARCGSWCRRRMRLAVRVGRKRAAGACTVPIAGLRRIMAHREILCEQCHE
jgi:hypothetical protein